MTPDSPYARIAITLPPDTLRAADELAAQQDRSRSWIVAEAIRQYAATQRGSARADGAGHSLGRSRFEQLRRDAALSPEARVLSAEETLSQIELAGDTGPHDGPRSFSSFDQFIAWQRERAER